MIQMSGLSGRPLFGSYLTMYSQLKVCHLLTFFLLEEGLFVWAIFHGKRNGSLSETITYISSIFVSVSV